MSHFDVNNLTELWRKFSKSSSKTYRRLFYQGFSAIQGLQLALSFTFTFIQICLPYNCIGCEAAMCNRKCGKCGTSTSEIPRAGNRFSSSATQIRVIPCQIPYKPAERSLTLGLSLNFFFDLHFGKSIGR